MRRSGGRPSLPLTRAKATRPCDSIRLSPPSVFSSRSRPAATAQNQPGSKSRATVRIDVTRDAWISEVGPEADGNNGGAPRLKLKSIQEMTPAGYRSEAPSGPDNPVGHASFEEGRR